MLKEWLSWIVVAIAALVLVVIGVAWIGGDDLQEPANHEVPASAPNLEATNVTFISGSGSLINGWLSRGNPGQGVVILLHGLRGDRRDMLSRAQFLRRKGYSALLFDFQAHGESRGNQITFGDLESRDVTAAIQYLQYELPDEKVAVLGASLGATAFVLANGRGPVAAAILEQMNPTIEKAVAGRARLHVGPLAPLLAPLLMVKLQSHLHIPEDRLRPIERVGRIGVPVLFIDGSDDSFTTEKDTRSLYAAASAPKDIWIVEGAGHVDLYNFAKDAYEKHVTDFLSRYLAPAKPLAPTPARPTPGSSSAPGTATASSSAAGASAATRRLRIPP